MHWLVSTLHLQNPKVYQKFIFQKNGSLKWNDGSPVGVQMWAPPYSLPKPSGRSSMSFRPQSGCCLSKPVCLFFLCQSHCQFHPNCKTATVGNTFFPLQKDFIRWETCHTNDLLTVLRIKMSLLCRSRHHCLRGRRLLDRSSWILPKNQTKLAAHSMSM